MPSKTDEQLLQELRTLPDVTLSVEKKQEIVKAIRSLDVSQNKSALASRRFTQIGKGLAICSVLLATVWMGSSLVNSNQPTGLPGTTNPDPAAASPGPSHAAAPTPVPQSEELLNSIRKQGEKGAVINAPYTVETTVFDTVEKEWGAPDRTDTANWPDLLHLQQARRRVWLQ